MTRIAILGAGRIGEALLAGLVSAGSTDIVATGRRQERLDELTQRHGVAATLSNEEAVRGADIVVLAAKPQDMAALLEEVAPHLTERHTVVSVAAAIPSAAIERHLADGVPVVRSMPNAPSWVHEGMAGISPGAHAGEEHAVHTDHAVRKRRPLQHPDTEEGRRDDQHAVRRGDHRSDPSSAARSAAVPNARTASRS